jgi:hypothetical protein
MENKLLTVCDEMGYFGGCYKTNDKLKSLIMQSEQNIKCKGIDTVTIHDYNYYIMQSNNQWSVHVEASDRWYVVIGCSEHRIGDFDYFTELKRMQTPKNANLLLTWLMSRDISQWNPRQIPDTELHHELKMRALDLPVQFLIYLISGKEERVVFGDEHKLPTSGMYGLFGDWLKNNGFCKVNYTERSFALSLNKIIKSKPMRIDGKPIRGYELDKELFTAALCKHLRMAPADLEEYM